MDAARASATERMSPPSPAGDSSHATGASNCASDESSPDSNFRGKGKTSKRRHLKGPES